jgi:rhodanese-related sulfurtransferase/rubrerythrin
MTTAIKSITADQSRAYMDRVAPQEYSLIDVRQEWEYKEFHLPGARHIPLADLLDRVSEIPLDKPVLVYCLSGGRSRVAASLLEGQGFEDVTDMIGGIMAWQGHTAFGPMDLGVIEFSGRETPQEVVVKAYAMEHKLQVFYFERADLAETAERIELFMELAGFEDQHMDTLFSLYKKIMDHGMSRTLFEEVALSSVDSAVEGGVDVGEYLRINSNAFDSDQGVLQFASMVEAQALDYYLRCSMRAEKPEARDTFNLLAREEKAHLKLLSRFMDRRDEQD